LSPALLFGINTLVVATVVLLLGWALYKCRTIDRLAVIVFTSLVYAWPYTFDLLAFPVLPEKGVILGVALCLFLIDFLQFNYSRFVNALVVIALFVIVAATGRSILLFIPFLVFISVVCAGRNRHQRITFVLSALLLTAGAALITWGVLTAEYTQNIRSYDLIANATSPVSLLYGVATCSFALLLIARRSAVNFLRNGLGPLILLITFWIALVAYGTMNQWLSIYRIPIALALAYAAQHLLDGKALRFAIGLSLMGAIAMTLFRVPMFYQPLHGIGQFVTSPIARDLARSGAVTEVWCAMGAIDIPGYFLDAGLAAPRMVWAPTEPDSVGYILADQRLCPPPRDLTNWKEVWSSPGRYGMNLYENPVQSSDTF
jgi:ABC-type uncharacterized transport system permease subunit